MPPKRSAESASKDTVANAKRFRSAIDESCDELMCPITYQLPLDPVTAEDGKIYERTAIEDWLKQHQRSPVTNLPMGSKLMPATQIKNMIERMVKSGALPEDKTAEWKKRIEEEEELNELRALAEAGDADSAYTLGICHEYGKTGVHVDKEKALKYYKQAAEAGSAEGMASLSSCYRYGKGVARNDALALRWAAGAHHLGNALGSLLLGRLYFDGAAGLPVDKKEGFELFKVGCDKGAASSAGLFTLATWYEKGEGTRVDLEQAAHWMRKAVKQNDNANTVQKARDWLIARGLPIEEDA